MASCATQAPLPKDEIENTSRIISDRIRDMPSEQRKRLVTAVCAHIAENCPALSGGYSASLTFAYSVSFKIDYVNTSTRSYRVLSIVLDGDDWIVDDAWLKRMAEELENL